MSGLDIVFIAAGLFALAAAGGVYAFAANIQRKYSAAAGEEASRPFEATVEVKRASEEGDATDIGIPANASLATQREPEREPA